MPLVSHLKKKTLDKFGITDCELINKGHLRTVPGI